MRRVERHDVVRAWAGRLNTFVDEVFCFTELGTRKTTRVLESRPDPARAQTNEVIMIGDSLEQDVLGRSAPDSRDLV